MIEDVSAQFGDDRATTQVQPREKPDVAPSRSAEVRRWIDMCTRVHSACERGAFKDMRYWMDYAYYGAKEETARSDDPYIAHLIHRQMEITRSSIYARNPRVQVRRRKQLDFAVWDGSPATLEQALAVRQNAQMLATGAPDPETGQPITPDPLSLAQLQAELAIAEQVIADVESAVLKKRQLDQFAKTLETLIEYYISEQRPRFKSTMKRCLRSAQQSGVGWLQLGLKRVMQPSMYDADQNRLGDMEPPMHLARALAEKLEAGDIDRDSPEAEMLGVASRRVMEAEEIVTWEGPTITYRQPWSVLVDPACHDLQTLAGAEFVFLRELLTSDQIFARFGVRLRSGECSTYSRVLYSSENERIEDPRTLIPVFTVWHAPTRTQFSIAEGYEDYLDAPRAPDVEIDRFFPFFALIFNSCEHHKHLYPRSDVAHMIPMQQEHNDRRERERRLRHASVPRWGAPPNAFDENEKRLLAHANSISTVIELKGLGAPGVKPSDLLFPIPLPEYNPQLYETSTIESDFMRTKGVQPAVMGASSGDTATEAAIAEQARGVTDAEKVDELDDFLTDIANGMAQVILKEVDAGMVLRIVGPGHVWPDQRSRVEIAAELDVRIKAGSSGRPNRAAEIAHFERMWPATQMLPGVLPIVQRKWAELFDEDVDPDEAFVAGIPSITALARMSSQDSQPVADAEADMEPETNVPDLQGPQGNANEERAVEAAPLGQPAFPTPVDMT